MTDGSSQTPPTARFDELGLPEDRLKVLESLGFQHPTPIQEHSIPVLLEGRDVVGIAQTGTGKTAAFGLPLLTRVNAEDARTQALVLAPTRELALQTTSALEDIAGPDSGVRFVTVYGGSSYSPQLRALREGTQVVVGTPGRIIDLLDRGALDLGSVNTLVLDEADEMLRMGFAEEVERILKDVPDERLTALYSATMPAAINRVAKQHLRDPQRIEVTSSASTVDTIRQTYAVVPAKFRFEALCRFLAMSDAGAGIVFVRTRKDAEEISLALSGRGFRAAGISGDVAQRERERLLEGLRKGALDVLVATDVAARGIDVERVGLVVNYEVPREAEQYVHRIGRTGRAGRDGESLTMFTGKEVRRLRQIERITGSSLEEVSVPTAAQVREKRTAEALQNALAGAEDIPQATLELLEQQKSSGMRYRDIAAALLAAAANTKSLGDVSEGAQERIDAAFAEGQWPAQKGRRGEGRRRDFQGTGTTYRVEVGRRDGVNPGAIVGAITGESGLKGSSLGKIDMFPSFSLVEIDHLLSSEDMATIGRATIRGRQLNISKDRGGRSPRSGGAESRGKQKGHSRGRWEDRAGKGRKKGGRGSQWQDRGRANRSGGHERWNRGR